MNDFVQFDPTSYDIESSEDVVGLAKSLVNGSYPGILATVDRKVRPQLRWMSTLSFQEFPVFYTLTSPESRKVSEIRACAEVNWMFFNKDLSLVLNLRGRARIVEDPVALKRIWNRIVDASHAYFLNQYAGELRYVAIETVVESIACNSTLNSVRFALLIRELSDAAFS